MEDSKVKERIRITLSGEDFQIFTKTKDFVYEGKLDKSIKSVDDICETIAKALTGELTAIVSTKSRRDLLTAQAYNQDAFCK